MTEFKTNIKLSDLSGALAHLNYGARLRPRRDWYTLLVIFFILLLASAAFNFYEYLVVQESTSVPAASTGSSSAAIQQSLLQAKAVFDSRNTEEQKYESGAYTFVDPSR